MYIKRVMEDDICHKYISLCNVYDSVVKFSLNTETVRHYDAISVYVAYATL